MHLSWPTPLTVAKEYLDRVVMTPHAALKYLAGILIIDIGRMSPSFVTRILKYGYKSVICNPSLMGNSEKKERLKFITLITEAYGSWMNRADLRDTKKTGGNFKAGKFANYDTTSLGYEGAYIFRFSAMVDGKPEWFNQFIYMNPKLLRQLHRTDYPNDFKTMCCTAINTTMYGIERLRKLPAIRKLLDELHIDFYEADRVIKIAKLRQRVSELYESKYLEMQRNFKPVVIVANPGKQHTSSIIPLKSSAFSWYGQRIKNCYVCIVGLPDLCYMACVSFMSQGKAITKADARKQNIFLMLPILRMLAMSMLRTIISEWKDVDEDVLDWYFDGIRRARMAELKALEACRPARVRK